MDEREIIGKFNAGDPQADRIIFKEFYQRICYFAGRFVSSLEEGKIIAIEVFEKLFQRRTKFDSLSKIEAFLYISSRNRGLNYLRSQERSRKREKEYFSLQDEKLVELERLEVKVVQRIQAAVASLPDQRRRVIEMLFYDDRSYEEIAITLGISESTVRNHKREAFKSLRDKLGPAQFLLFMISVNFGLLQYLLSQSPTVK